MDSQNSGCYIMNMETGTPTTTNHKSLEAKMNRLNKPNAARAEHKAAAEKAIELATEILREIQIRSDENESAKINYGHVGDMSYLVSNLTEIRDRLTGQGEYK